MKPRATRYHKDQNGQCASEVLRSATPVEIGDGVPCNKKDRRDELEITKFYLFR